MFSTLSKQKKLLPLLTGALALGYLLAVAMPLVNHAKIGPEQINSPANSTFVSLPNEIAHKQHDFIQITEWHLFGLPTSQSASSNGELQETQLELKLQGVFFLAQHQKMGHAIIESADQIQKTYKINDELPGGGILQAIEDNKIIILRENQQEYLELDRKKTETVSDAESLPEPEPAVE